MLDHLVDYQRMLSGGRRRFGAAEFRDFVRRDLERARDFAAVRNHDLMPQGETPSKPLSVISAPTLVIHGTADPMFPMDHGKALAEEIRGGRLLLLADAGHGVYRADWEQIAGAILDHTAAGGRSVA